MTRGKFFVQWALGPNVIIKDYLMSSLIMTLSQKLKLNFVGRRLLNPGVLDLSVK